MFQVNDMQVTSLDYIAHQTKYTITHRYRTLATDALFPSRVLIPIILTLAQTYLIMAWRQMNTWHRQS